MATRALAAMLVWALATGCDGGGAATPDSAVPADTSTSPSDAASQPDGAAAHCETATGNAPAWFDEPCDRWSRYGMFSLDDEGRLVPNEGVLPYTVINPLFADYAQASRTVWMPEGTTASYTEHGLIEFPIGTVLSITFGYPADLRQPERNIQRIDTRVLVRKEQGWEPLVFVWNEEQTKAELQLTGTEVEVSWVHYDGTRRTTAYPVPNLNQCIDCHGNLDPTTGRKEPTPSATEAKHLNTELDYGAFFPGEDPENQLARWRAEGFLEGAPVDPAQAPRLPRFDDPSTGSLNRRARAYLDVNCAHCHNSYGGASGSGLNLGSDIDDPFEWGVCQQLQRGIGGDVTFNIVPGNPEQSAVMYRMDTTDPAEMMPRLGRTVIHTEAVGMIREWINWLGTSEGIEQHGLDSERFSCF